MGANRPIASILLPCHNQLDFTRLCCRSLIQHTRPPWKLVAVDNGSSDGTLAYLQGLRDVGAVPVEVLRNDQNRGFPAAINQALPFAADTPFLVLLNNDVVVTDGWLDQLIALADADPAIGLVGPMSNYASPPQYVDDVPYHDLDEMHRFARQWRNRRLGTWFPAEKLSGFCLLVKRSVVDAVGGLDERFGIGLFDDDDFSLRARAADFRLAVAHDLFIHHFGSRTFQALDIDSEALLEENQGKFQAKWGGQAPRGAPVVLTPWGGTATEPGCTAVATRGNERCRVSPPTLGLGAENLEAHPSGPRSRRCRVSLTMIVKDEERNLPECLESVAHLVDELVIVDTGSTDGTREIVRRAGAILVDFLWVDSFAAARNAALARASGDYVLWLDADDRLEHSQQPKLREVSRSLDRDRPTAFVFDCACDPDIGAGSTADFTVVQHVRLFPRLPGAAWEYRVHEQVLPSLRRLNVPVVWTDVTIRHTGYSDPATRARKLERDWRLLSMELAANPDEPFMLFNAGCVAIERRDWPTALDFLQRGLARSESTDSITRKLHALIAKARQELGDLEESIAACDAGLQTTPDDAELLFRRGVARRKSGDAAGAESDWLRVLELGVPTGQFRSVDMGIHGHLTRRNLAALYESTGEAERAWEQWRAVLAERPGDEEARRRLAWLDRERA